MPEAKKKIAYFRFYAELNDFLPYTHRQHEFTYYFWGSPSLNNAIQALGIPHTEVDLILLNGEIAGSDESLNAGDRISVYPQFKNIDIDYKSPSSYNSIQELKFVIDVNLGKLTKYLRMLGLDSLYDNHYEDTEIIQISRKDKRIILTRDLEILKHNLVIHGYYIRSTVPKHQLTEVISKYDLLTKISPFTRCMKCNGLLNNISNKSIQDHVKKDIFEKFDEFFRCGSCSQIYWEGSHYEKMKETINSLKVTQ